jgi:hypothetical protein
MGLLGKLRSRLSDERSHGGLLDPKQRSRFAIVESLDPRDDHRLALTCSKPEEKTDRALAFSDLFERVGRGSTRREYALGGKPCTTIEAAVRVQAVRYR